MKSASIFTLTLLAALPVLGQNVMAWVSHSGSDANSCSLTSPCATFQRAYGKTNIGGIIKALNAGEYGPITISKPIIIDGNGVGASIQAPSGIGPNVAVIMPGSGRVEIRSVAIHVPASCTNCVALEAHSSNAIIEDVSVTGTPYYGVDVTGTVASPGTATIRGVTVTGAQNTGILVQGAKVTISDSMVRNSGNIGIQVNGQTAAAQVLIQRTRMLSNFQGLYVWPDGYATTAWISDCVISGNGTGIVTQSGAQAITFRNNTWLANTTDGATPFSVSLK